MNYALVRPSDLPEAVINDNARTVLERRYFTKDENGVYVEDATGMFWRVASAIAAEEAKYEKSPYSPDQLAREFYDLMTNGVFLPNSPTLMNAGKPGGQLAACFVLPVGDSMEEIFDAVKNAAMIHKSGGGTGFSFSRLRPKDARVGSTGGVASGPVSFMRIFNTATEQVKQGGTRRGANMGVLRVDHPDILEFIDCKKQDGELTNFNISVAVTDAFMEAVESGTSYFLLDPRDGSPVDELDARSVFEKLVYGAWKTADPGILYIDRINRDNPTPTLGGIESTNPCFTGEMRLLTAEGYRTFRELADKEVEIVSYDGRKSSGRVWKTGVKPVVKISMQSRSGGFTIRCTEDHVFMLADGSTCRADEIKKKRLMPFVVMKDCEASDKDELLAGFIQGDGCLGRMRSKDHQGLEVRFGEKDGDVAALWNQSVGIWYSREAMSIARNKFLDPAPLPNRHLPEDMSDDFLTGLYSANGCVIRGQRVSFKTSCQAAAQQLLARLKSDGIEAYVTTNKPHAVEFANGIYVCKQSYDVNIGRYESLVKFAEKINFIHNYKRKDLLDLLLTRSPLVTSVVSDGVEDVYDFQEPINHWGVVEGFIAHNCGEVPLLPYEACNLGSINVSKFWLSEGRFDWDGFKRAIHLGVRFLDNVIDASKYPLPVIEENVKRNRKIGLGLMGVADLFFLNGRAYDSEETVEFAKTLMEFTRDEAWIASTYLADERGAFPTFEDSVWSTGQKLRNATTNTIAPTGTLSIIAGCSSGIEPLFALAFARHVMDGDKLVEANPHFIQALKDRGLYTEELMEKVIAAGSIAKMEELPADLRRVFVTAMDISPMAHLRMQAAFQQYTDNAVSKTVNLPSSATEDDIREIYVQAWSLGCKGVTVYRDGCKADQVLRTGNGQAQTQPEPVVASPSVRQMRPEVVPGFTQKVRTGLGTLYLTVNEVGGKPFEIFATIGKSGRSVTAKAEAIGRLVSLALRSGVDVADVVEQIKGIGGENPIFREKGLLLSIPDAVAWVLECRYLRGCEIHDSVAQIGKVLCPDCGSELIFEEGCNVCKSCGYSRCAG